ncbi:MAG: tRNA uridine-5-carboxymethylaminomethyl(34) synthesis GTPase MnmE [Caulobacter sp.]|nr:tRNA uridine-5-carboxymethylaminomethyl(34) synthesis GTPase MnmE [Caulobacter sp.]
MTDTIFALATAPGRAALAVVRVSGPEAARVLRGIAGGAPTPRRASLRRLRTPEGKPIDKGLVLWFPGPNSYTGEDCAEFHLHGGIAVVDSLISALQDLGLRLAEPGEFTRRAFEHGQLDLVQAEAVADLIDAETAAQAMQAVRQLESTAMTDWREGLIEALANFEVAVDFPDEDLQSDTVEHARSSLRRLLRTIQDAIGDAERGRRIREGFRIALIGAPNAGKSSLLNGLLGRDAAIVTATPGTTRDVIEAPLIIAGYRVLVADTAGVRETTDEIEAEGVRRAEAWARDADLRVWVLDASASNGSWRRARVEMLPGDLCVLNKQDLPAGSDAAAVRAEAEAAGMSILSVAVAAGGADAVRAWLESRVIEALSASETPAATRQRHRDGLVEAAGLIDSALHQTEPELAVEDLRLAVRALGRIVGIVDPEAVLDRVFASFCIGK